MLKVIDKHNEILFNQSPEGITINTLRSRGQVLQECIEDKNKQDDYEVIVDEQNKKVYVKNKLTNEQTDNLAIIFKQWLEIDLSIKKETP